MELYALEFRMFLRHVYIAVEKHHEVGCDLVYIGLIFRYDRYVVAYVDWNWRKLLKIPPRRGYFVFDLVVEIIEPVALSGVAGPVYNYHWKLVHRLPL